MHPSEWFGFSSGGYREKISNRMQYKVQDIALNIYKKRRAINASKVSVASGIAAAHLTGGSSLLGSACSVRNIDVEKRKLEMLEQEWLDRGQYPLPKRPIQDMVIPVIIATATGLFAYTVDLGLSNAAMQNAMYPIGSPFHYPYDISLVGKYYDGLELGAQNLANRVMNKYDERANHHKEYE